MCYEVTAEYEDGVDIWRYEHLADARAMYDLLDERRYFEIQLNDLKAGDTLASRRSMT